MPQFPQTEGESTEVAYYEGLSGEPWDWVDNYGSSLEPFQGETSMDKVPEGLECLATSDVRISEALDNLTRIANSTTNPRNEYVGALYALNYALLIRDSLQKIVGNSNDSSALYAPLRGGEIPIIMALTMKIRGKIPTLRTMRMHGLNNEYAVGTRMENRDVPNEITIIDDCCAAAGSIDSILMHLFELNEGITHIQIVVGVAVKSSSKALVKKWKSKGIEVEFVTGDFANGMDENYYLELTDEEKATKGFPLEWGATVGDMGDWMDLTHVGKRELIVPLLQAVSTGALTTEDVLDATLRAFKSPEERGKIVRNLLRKASGVSINP